MPSSQLNLQIQALRKQLDSDSSLDASQQAELSKLLHQLEAQHALEAAAPDTSLIDGVNFAVERFELSHPSLATTLRNIMNTLGSMGI